MTATVPEPSGHTFLDFNAPLSDARAHHLIDSLRPLTSARVVDLGCGWAEFLQRLLEAEPTATGIGVDTDTEAIDRGRANAVARDLSRVELVDADVTGWAGAPADVVISIGASHAWAGTGPMLAALRQHTRPGGRVLVGDAIWDRTPTEAALAVFGGSADEFGSLADLIELSMNTGYRVLSVSVASVDEWDDFESRFCAGRERWLLDHPDAPNAEEVRRAVDEHRWGWLRGYRGVLGFAYLTLAVPTA